MSLYIGMDLGTSSLKLCLVNSEGTVLRESDCEYDLLTPELDWKEIDPEVWWHSVGVAMAELLVGIDGSEVRCIGVTGQMHTLVMLDETGRCVRNAMMWNDTRTAGLIPELVEYIKGTDVEYLQGILSTGTPLANIYWVKKNEAENFRNIRRFLIGPDYIVFRLTGAYSTDFCEASTSVMYDTVRKCWSGTIRNIVGLSESVYPPVRGSAEIAGDILPEVAGLFGINPKAKVIVGTGDNPAASVPTGCLGNDYPVFSMGTSGVLMFPRKELDYNLKGKNILFSFDGEKCNILVQGVIQSCGSSFAWWNRDILEREDYNIDNVFDIDHIKETPVIFYPHLVGDKTIYGDPGLRGCFIGLGTDTDRKDMLLAVVEGISFALRQLTEELGLKDSLCELRIIGGASKSRVWAQLLADVMNLPIAQMSGCAGAGYGMALLAAYAYGDISSIDSISAKAVNIKEMFTPREDMSRIYEEKYRRYLNIHEALKMIYN